MPTRQRRIRRFRASTRPAPKPEKNYDDLAFAGVVVLGLILIAHLT